ncbi:MAG: hypothetical protein IPP12_07275 [Nitrospira sp.]|nr:hypothetical protein [Nitrospira sp.]MBK9946967.1 hypothetical protein [Nitrospira sp.]
MVVIDEYQRDEAVSDHVLNLLCHALAEVWPTSVEASAEISGRLNL